MSKSVAVKAVSIDFLSQVSDLRKRRELLLNRRQELVEAQFFGAPEGTQEYKDVVKELGATTRALDILDGLEVDCD